MAINITRTVVTAITMTTKGMIHRGNPLPRREGIKQSTNNDRVDSLTFEMID